MLRALCCLLSLSAIAPAQDPAQRCADALLRGDRIAAARAAAAAADPALRARLQAALAPMPQRAAAMLAVACQFADSAEADAAILAGAAAALVRRDGGGALPDLAAWLEQEAGDATDADPVAPAPVIEGLWRKLQDRQQAGGDADTLAEAERLLLLCSVSRFGFEPARVRPTASWVLPELREDALLRSWRRQPGMASWQQIEQLGLPQQRALLANGDATAPGLTSGDWLVELASVARHWRGLRAVEVSDLDVVAMVDHGVLALGVWRVNEPAASGSWQLYGPEATPRSGAFANGSTVAWPVVDPGAVQGEDELRVRSGSDGAWLRLPSTQRPYAPADRWQAHVMLDRPVYRAGETVMGRVVLRRCRYEGQGLDAVAHPEPAAAQAIVVRAFADDGAEVRVDGRTDADGIYSFAVPVPHRVRRGHQWFEVEVPAGADDAVECEGYGGCEIADYRRAALLVDVTGPGEARLGGVDPQLALHAAWASGAPAAGLPVMVEISCWSAAAGTRSERHELATDGEGNAVATIALQHLQPGWVQASFTVTTPDGSESRHTCSIRIRGDDVDVEERPRWRRSPDPLWVHAPDVATVGVPCRVVVEGRAHAHVLLVAGRGHGARAWPVQLDDAGRASIEVTPTRNEWPQLDVAAAAGTETASCRVPLRLHAPTDVQVDLPRQCRPGEAIACRIATGIARSIVTVAVVDERIYAIAEDRTREPEAELRPAVPMPAWRAVASAPFLTPAQLLGALLEDGRVAATDDGGRIGPTTGGPAGGAAPGGGAGVGELRSDFRSTAAFATVVAGADGVAEVPFTLPDDLTTWRVGIVGIAPDGSAFVQRRALTTRLPLGGEALLPRVLRQGDRVLMPVTVDRAASTSGDDGVLLQVGSDGTALRVEAGDLRPQVPAGTARTVSVPVQAIAAGDAALTVAVGNGAASDRSRRALAVQPDAVMWSLPTAVARGSGRVEVQVPADADPRAGIDVTVLGSGMAAWRAIERQLSEYPHGCVEQTLSRLLPFFAAVRGARAHGAPPPVADAEFRERLLAGLRRLRELQVGRGGGFSFWPGGDVDTGMTAMVLHGLAVMREGGVDPAGYGLHCDAACEPFASACKRVMGRHGAVANRDDVMAAELAAACLHLAPDSTVARTAVTAVADAGGALPPGLLARIGLALRSAGDRDRAARSLSRLDAMPPPANLAPDGFPGDDPLVVQASILELHCLLTPAAAANNELIDEVLQQCMDVRCTTLAQAGALCALALALAPAAAAGPLVVQVEAGGVERRIELTAGGAFTARLQLPFAAQCCVVTPPGMPVLVRVDSMRRERGSDHAGWSRPIEVDRQLCRKRSGATPEQIASGDDLEQIGDSVPQVGERLWLRIAVRSPVAMRYVLVECPLPAGLEPVEQPWWLERFDDRIAFTVDWLADKPAQRVVAVMPTMAGTMSWPPAVAMPMYARDGDGGCPGSVLHVAAATGTAAGPATATCLSGPVPEPRPEPEPTRWQRLWHAVDELRAVLATDPEALPERVEPALATLTPADAEDDRAAVLCALNDLVVDMRHREAPAGDVALSVRIERRQQQTTRALLDDFERRPVDGWHDDRVELLAEALALWPEAQNREALLVRLLRLVIARRSPLPASLLRTIPGPVTTAALRSELLAALAAVDADARCGILELLPLDCLATLPPAALAAALDDVWPEGLVAVMLQSVAGRAELERCLQRPAFVRAQSAQLSAALPRRWWRRLPLQGYAEMAGSIDADELLNGRGIDLATRLSGSTVTTAALQRELVAAHDIDWQLVLAMSLRRRGVHDLGLAAPAAAATDGSIATWWQRGLAIADGDAAAALRFLVDLRARALPARTEVLAAFIVPVLVEHGTAAQLAVAADALDKAQCLTVLARLDAASRRELIAAATGRLAALPAANDAADCQALWDFGARCDAFHAVLEALCRTDPGLEFVNQHAGSLDADRRGEARCAYAEAMGFDADTMLPAPDQPWLPVLRDAGRHGVAAARPAAAQAVLHRLRQLRGL